MVRVLGRRELTKRVVGGRTEVAISGTLFEMKEEFLRLWYSTLKDDLST